MAAEALAEPAPCFHCGLDVPPGTALAIELLGASRSMCCAGCAAVAEMLRDQGLERWYEDREAPSGVAAEVVPRVLEQAAFLRLRGDDRDFERRDADGRIEVGLLVEGMTCGACAWLIERALASLPGIVEARVNLVGHRVRVAWRDDACSLEQIVARLASIGFPVRPDGAAEAIALRAEARRDALVRLGIAGLATMNVMTYAVALYLGAAEEMSAATLRFLRWACWLVATPVVLVSARPHFEAAWRDLRTRRPGMDVPIALAIGGAYLASAAAVVRGEGEVYFESVCMFTFLIGLGRFLELGVRQRSDQLSRRLVETMPELATGLSSTGLEETVPARRLRPGDRIRVRPGEVVPVDARVVAGAGDVEEAVLSGEPWPRRVAAGDAVRAGAVNAASVLELEVERSVDASTLGVLRRLIDRAQSEKPELARWADRVGSHFVIAVLVIACGTALVWALLDPSRVVQTTLAVLVATCPCALGLATPTALAAAGEGLARAGFVVTRGSTLEVLARVDRVVFDKTGTLTGGSPRIERLETVRGIDREDAIARARALEAGSSHVFARAFAQAGAGGRVTLAPTSVRAVDGCGGEGALGGVRHRLGRPDWAIAVSNVDAPPDVPDREARTWVLLADERGAIAWFGLGDLLRPEASDALDALRATGVELELLTGDAPAAAERVASALGIPHVSSGVSPAEKLARVRAHQSAGERVAFVGDGLNDGPVLRGADVSIAMAGACDLSLLSADAMLYRDDLRAVARAIRWARRTRRVVAQNFVWAIGYNALVLPLAVTGRLSPWLAAVGMSASSLLVALNATRLRRDGEGAWPSC